MRGQMAHLHVTRAHTELAGSMLKIIVLAGGVPPEVVVVDPEPFGP